MSQTNIFFERQHHFVNKQPGQRTPDLISQPHLDKNITIQKICTVLQGVALYLHTHSDHHHKTLIKMIKEFRVVRINIVKL
jgi:hypothetical protein